MMKFLFTLLFSISAAFAQVKESDKAFFPSINFLKNPGFESGLAQWTASGGSFTAVTAGNNLGFGFSSAAWDSSGNGQTLTSSLVSIPAGLFGGYCVASFFYKTAETTLAFRVIDGSSSNIYGPTTLASASNFTLVQFPFTCPSSGTLALRFTSTVSNSAVIYLDNLFLGMAFGSLYSYAGLVAPYFQSTSANPASAGTIRLANTDLVRFRNSANNGDISFTTGSSDSFPSWNSIDLVTVSNNQTLTNKTVSGSSNTLSNIADGSLTTPYIKADGTRALSGNWNAGAFNITAASHISNSANVASTGTIRLANTDLIRFRNAANSGDISLTTGSSDSFPSWNSIDLVTSSLSQTITNKTLSGSSNTFSNIADGSLTTSYLKADGTRPLTGAWSVGAFQVLLGGVSSDTTDILPVGNFSASANGILSAATQNGVAVDFTATSAATTAVRGIRSFPRTANASFTIPVVTNFLADTISKGASSVITRSIQYELSGALTVGTNNAGVADNESFTGNYFIHSTNTNPTLITGPTTIGGTATNDSAASGFVGEILTANSAGITPAASGSFANIVSKSLTAGDWDVECDASLVEAATLAATRIVVAVSTSSAATDSTNNGGIATENSFLVSSTAYIPTGARRISLSATTTVFCVGALTYTVLSTTTYGVDSIIRARRAR